MEVDINLSQAKPDSSSAETLLESNLCNVCAYQNAKFACPKCDLKVCSLKCKRMHKLDDKCYRHISIKKFTNLNLTSDFNLMEEISKTIEAARNKYGRRDEVPKRLYKLKKAAKLKRVTLKFLPPKFERRATNTTYYHTKQCIIYWRIQWVFVNADNLKLFDAKIPETEILNSILAKYLVKQEDEHLQERLKYYQAAKLPGIKLYLKAEQKVGMKFYELDSSLTLKECLEKKVIIECPTIHVVLKDCGLEYSIIDSDDENIEDSFEDNWNMKSESKVVPNIKYNVDNDENLYKSIKNLLFISEYSDQEMSSEK